MAGTNLAALEVMSNAKWDVDLQSSAAAQATNDTDATLPMQIVEPKVAEPIVQNGPVELGWSQFMEVPPSQAMPRVVSRSEFDPDLFRPELLIKARRQLEDIQDWSREFVTTSPLSLAVRRTIDRAPRTTIAIGAGLLAATCLFFTIPTSSDEATTTAIVTPADAARAHVAAGDPWLAITKLEPLVASGAAEADVHAALAIALAKQSQNAKALEQFTRAAEKDVGAIDDEDLPVLVRLCALGDREAKAVEQILDRAGTRAGSAIGSVALDPSLDRRARLRAAEMLRRLATKQGTIAAAQRP